MRFRRSTAQQVAPGTIGQELEGDVAARMLRQTQSELLPVPNEVLSHWERKRNLAMPLKRRPKWVEVVSAFRVNTLSLTVPGPSAESSHFQGDEPSVA